MGKVKITITIVRDSRTIIQEIFRVLELQCSCCGGYAAGTRCACGGSIWRAGFWGMTCVTTVVASSLDSSRSHLMKISGVRRWTNAPKDSLDQII
jgi:hypothetical protein